MVNLHPTTSIITSEVNVLHSPIKRHRLSEETGLKNKTNYMLSRGEIVQIQKHKWVESELIEKDIQCKHQTWEPWCDYINVR